MKVNPQTYKKPRIEMLPLIDIVFLLLVFFIYAMLSMAVHRGLDVLLPESSTAKVDKNLIITVSVDAHGVVFLDKQEIRLEDLPQKLILRARKEKETGVLLFADRNLPYQRLFRVLDQIKMVES